MAKSIVENIKVMTSAPQEYPLTAPIPNNIMVETTNTCNLRCEMCFNKCMKRKKGFMSFEIFKKIVDQAAELKIENIGLYTTGESFLHPLIFDFIKYAKQKGINYVYITTNGQALNDEKIEKIFESGLDSIKFSIDSGNKSHYESLKKGANWDKLIEIITKVRNRRDELKSQLRIFASFIVMKDNLQDLYNYNQIFSQLIDETNFTTIENQGSRIESTPMSSDTIQSILDGQILPESQWHPCNLLWNRFVVTYEGLFSICCFDFDNQLVYGDINKNTLSECWNSQKMQTFRRIHKARLFSNLPLCNNCDKVKTDPVIYEILNTKVRQILTEPILSSS